MAIRDYLTKTKADFKKFQSRNQMAEYRNNKLNKNLYVKCRECGNASYFKDLEEMNFVCTCGAYFRMHAKDRLNMIIDSTFVEFGSYEEFVNPLEFKDYDKKIERARDASDLDEAVITGYASIGGVRTVVLVMDSHFMMGSMGSVVGQKITRAVERATRHNYPVVAFIASGGARMQEGIMSLMQMAKTSAAFARHNESGNLYIPILTNPTYGGVTASFAMLGDIILAEPKAMIGFAGKLVIEQTIKQELPEGFQTSEFLLEKGFIDMIVKREELRHTLVKLLQMHKEAK